MINSKSPAKQLFMTMALIVAIIAVSFFCYGGVKDHQFINFDDNLYITNNFYVLHGLNVENIKWAFSFNNLSYWQPLTWLAHMLDVQLFGLQPGFHLLVNLLLHIFNSILLFLILLRISHSQAKAFFVAVLFAVHPLNVESVAWAAERKMVLSTFFLFSALYLYVLYAQNISKWKYFSILFIYSLGLLTKPAIVIFPLLLFLLDYWPLKRFAAAGLSDPYGKLSLRDIRDKVIHFFRANAKIIWEKIPLLFLSLLSVLLTMLSVWRPGMIVTQENISMLLRVYNYFVSIFLYLQKIAWPVELSIYYPFPNKIVLSYFLVSLFAFTAITVFVIILRKNKPWLLMGWLWFLVALFPASGFVQAGLWPSIANRFMYIPMIGIFVMVVWEFDNLLKGKYSDVLKKILAVALILCFALLTRYQVVFYSNSYALFGRALKITGENGVLLNNMGEALFSLGRAEEALDYFERSIKSNPRYFLPYYNYGVVMLGKKENKKAIEYFKKTINLVPRFTEAYLALSIALSQSGKEEEAFKTLEAAVKLDENNFKTRNAYAALLVSKGRYQEAIDHYLYMVQKYPYNVQTRLSLAAACQNAGFYDKALSEYTALLRMSSREKGQVYYEMAGLFCRQNKNEKCGQLLDQAAREGFDISYWLPKDDRFKTFRASSALHGSSLVDKKNSKDFSK